MCNKNNLVILKTYNSSNIEQLGFWSVWLKHKDKVVRCRLFVVPGDIPALLGMSDIKLFGISENNVWGTGPRTREQKFDSQIKEISGTQENNRNKTSTSNAGATYNCIYMPKKQTKKQADYWQWNCIMISVTFSQVLVVWRHIQAIGERVQPPISIPNQKGSLCTIRATMRRTR